MSSIRYTPLSRGESFWLDILRGVAVLFVVYAHAQQIFISPYWFPHYPSPDRPFYLFLYQYISSFAMMTFFSMSGCLIYHSAMRNIREFGTFSVKEYVLARLLRLYPPLVFSLLVLILIYYVLDFFGFHSKTDFVTGEEIYIVRESLLIDWKNILGSLFFLNTLAEGFESPILNGPMWSLAHEFWFYVFGMFFVFFSLRNWVFALIMTMGVSYYAYTNHEFWFLGFAVWFISFVMSHLEYGYVDRKLSTRVGLFGGFLFLCIWGWFAFHHSDSWFSYRNYFIFGMAFSFFLPVALRFVRHSSIKKSFWGEGIIGVSRFSYTMYLIHFPIFIFIFVTTNLIISNWVERIAITVVSVFSSALVAWKASQYVENKHIMKVFLRRWM